MQKSEVYNSSLEKTIHQEYFDNKVTQNLFLKWCEANGKTTPHFISRHKWEERKKDDIIFEQGEKKSDLYIPTDLKLYEMLTLMDAAGQPERSRHIEELGKTFQHVAVYLAKRLDGIPRGREYAEEMIKGFYEYGYSLEKRMSPDLVYIPDLQKIRLTLEEERQVDEWLIGKDAYERRMKRIHARGESEDTLEQERRKILRTYFTLLTRTKPRSESDPKEPWLLKQAPLAKLREDIDQTIRHALETPKRELFSVDIQKGMKNLLQDIRLPGKGWERKLVHVLFVLQQGFGLPGISFDYNIQEQLLRKELGIETFKKELEEARKSGDIEKISQKEIEVAQKIHEAVSAYPYKSGYDQPEQIRDMQYRNCVGASLIGGELLREVGIGYGVVSIPRHSFLVFYTSDKRLFLADMLYNSHSKMGKMEITDKDMQGETIVRAIERLGRNDERGVHIVPVSRQLKDKVTQTEQGTNFSLYIHPPEYGQKVQVLGNLGWHLLGKGFREEAREAFELIVRMNPDIVNAYEGLAAVFHGKDIKKEREMLQRAAEHKPNDPYLYVDLAIASFHKGETWEAIQTVKEAIQAFKRSRNINAQFYTRFIFGEFLEKVGNIKEALTQYLEIRKKNPDDIETHIKLGSLYMEIGWRADAFRAYRDALKINPERPDIFFQIGIIYEQWMEATAALTAYETALQLAEKLNDQEIVKKSQKKVQGMKDKIQEWKEKRPPLKPMFT